MGRKDPRVDAYLARAADFAKPILTELRKTVHEACPEVEEDMKWSFPHFMYKGILCSMASFRQHCAFGFWKGSLVLGGRFDAFSPSHRREYVEWITEAKSEDTRNRRLETAIEWMAEGKTRNWKYQRV